MLTLNPNDKLIVSLFGAVVILFIGILLVTDPIPQDSAYHQFADRRSWLLPNFLDVVSNLPFAVIGLAGLRLCRRARPKSAALSWTCFFAGLCLLALGSSYYHWHPNDQTLVWDRLPMTISFMSLFVALLTETLSLRHEKTLLIAAIIIGLSSVVYGYYLEDLRFYGLIQFGPLLILPPALWLHHDRHHRYRPLLYGLLCYILAKIFELNDHLFFAFSGQSISGHTLKHLLAAAATYCIYWMLNNRQHADTL